MKLRILQIGPLILALLGVTSFFLLLGVPWVRNTAIPNLIILLVAIAWAIYNLKQEKSAWTIAPLILALLVSSLFVYIRFIYAKLSPAEVKVSIDQPAPDFTLLDYQSNSFALSSLKGKYGAVIVFYRGVW